jgi:vacuolar-type H+-ATPase subunit F/Vma7
MDKQIAAIGDPELTTALRLAGVRRTRAIRAEPGAAPAIAETLGQWLAADEIGLIVIGADHAALARDLVSGFRASRRLSPVIVEVPSRDGAWATDATDYYQRLGREFLGLEIVLQDDDVDALHSGTA